MGLVLMHVIYVCLFLFRQRSLNFKLRECIVCNFFTFCRPGHSPRHTPYYTHAVLRTRLSKIILLFSQNLLNNYFMQRNAQKCHKTCNFLLLLQNAPKYCQFILFLVQKSKLCADHGKCCVVVRLHVCNF